MARIKDSKGKFVKENLVGKKFNRLLVVNEASPIIRSNNSKVIQWNCACDCGSNIIVNTSNLLGGGTKSCGCLKKEELVKRNKLGRHPRGTRNIPWSEFKRIMDGAHKRKHEFNITIEFIQKLLEKQNYKCAVTGLSIKVHPIKEKTASLDRIDSSIGYKEDNVQWVHKDINWMKQDYSMEEFVSYCQLVSNYENNNIYLNKIKSI